MARKFDTWSESISCFLKFKLANRSIRGGEIHDETDENVWNSEGAYSVSTTATSSVFTQYLREAALLRTSPYYLILSWVIAPAYSNFMLWNYSFFLFYPLHSGSFPNQSHFLHFLCTSIPIQNCLCHLVHYHSLYSLLHCAYSRSRSSIWGLISNN